ncbi:MAG: basic amino acid transporter substrate-binding protein [Acidimicrobiales bacterium]|nr:basic amino acid transporter substrate-binding protein [Acidimicrobiales bacterium]
MCPNGRKHVVVVGLALAIALGATGCSSSHTTTASSGGPPAGPVLTVCSDIPNRPMEYEGPGPRGLKYTGFDIELFDAMAQRLNRTIAVTPVHATPFEKIFDRLAIAGPGGCDVVVSSVTITDQRRQAVALSAAYFTNDQSLLVRRASGMRRAADVVGKTVGVPIGTTAQRDAGARLPQGVSIKGFADAAGLRGALETGSIQAIFQDLPTNANLVIEDKSVAVIATFPTTEQFGFAVRKDRTALRDQLNTALGQVRADGTYAALHAKYFPTS